MPLTIKVPEKRLISSAAGSWHPKVAPLLAVSVGTAGCRRNWGFLQRMGDARLWNRVQSATFYDFNRSTAARLMGTVKRLKDKNGLLFQVPGYIPIEAGFAYNPHSLFRYAPIDHEVDRLIAAAQQHSIRIGSPPRLVIVFMGFGGHATLGCGIYKKLRAAFPAATFLPVVSIPQDPGLEQWMRDCTWAEFEEALRGEVALVTDNSLGNLHSLDDKLAVGLASIECVGQAGTGYGTLADDVATYAPFGSGWLGLSVVRQKLPSYTRMHQTFPIFRRYLSRGQRDDLVSESINAIRNVMEPGAQLASHAPPEPTTPQMIALTLPLPNTELELLKQNVMEQLTREGFFAQHPQLAIGFAPANLSVGAERVSGVRNSPRFFSHRTFNRTIRLPDAALRAFIRLARRAVLGDSADELYLNVARLYPVKGPIPRVIEILHRTGTIQAGRVPGNTGFGSNYHLAPSAFDGPLSSKGANIGSTVDHHSSYKERIEPRIMPIFQSLVFEGSEQGRKRAKHGVLKALEEDLHTLLPQLNDRGVRSSLSRWFSGQGFSENFIDPNIRNSLTLHFGLWTNRDYVQACRDLNLPIREPARFEAWCHFKREAGRRVAEMGPRDKRDDVGTAKDLIKVIEYELFEVLLCDEHAAKDYMGAMAKAQLIANPTLGSQTAPSLDLP